MMIPGSTYRVQLHKEFTFNDLEAIIGYLDGLGITTIYAAPLFAATAGSLHGYDVIDPHRINPAIGTLEDFRRISKKLRARNMSWIQDIVPNHMAFNTSNFRLMDVLERGPQSPFYRYFDIDWEHPSPRLKGRVQVPFLGSDLDSAIERGEINLSFSEAGFSVDYFDNSFPLSLPALEFLFGCAHDSMFPCSDYLTMARATRDYRDWTNDKEVYLSSILNNERLNGFVSEFLRETNRDKERLRKVLGQLHYRLCHWKDTDREINYRRFFTVNELICLRMEDKTVFDEYHQLISTLVGEGLVQGLRIDHIDGLYDPEGYVGRLRALVGAECYIIAEKILEHDERIPETWQIQGTSGYEFLSYVSQLITNRTGMRKLVDFYRALVPDLPPYDEIVSSNKRLILKTYMAGEWENLGAMLMHLPELKSFDPGRTKEVLAALMIAFPVYRIYPTQLPLTGEGAERMVEAHRRALRECPELAPELGSLVALFLDGDARLADREAVLSFLRRLMQFTGPLTAKGVEDTTFYVYNALISHDEVGDAPSHTGISVENFHSRMTARRDMFPLSMNTTSTHDTKRGEDARLRLNLLAEHTDEWIDLVNTWMSANRTVKQKVDEGIAPSANDEYYIYQAITGGLPEDFTVTDEWIERITSYAVKALREAKVHTNWNNPNVAYEEACVGFIQAIVDQSAFMESFEPFVRKLVGAAHAYSRAQVLLKMMAPGIPDTYQGCELWDLSFVDPDNRRPVDYATRMDILEQIRTAEKRGWIELSAVLRSGRERGWEKLFITHKALILRRAHPKVFSEGEYVPLRTVGGDAVVVAFARRHRDAWVLVVVPLNVPKGTTLNSTRLVFPGEAPEIWTNWMTGKTVTVGSTVSVGELLEDFPVGLLVRMTNE